MTGCICTACCCPQWSKLMHVYCCLQYNQGMAFTEGERGRPYLRRLLPPALLRGLCTALASLQYNKGMAFTEGERDRMYLRGLLPPAVLSQEVQADRVMQNIRNKPNDLEKHTYLMSLQVGPNA